MTLAATFLGGAKNRLLPASVPFRYFASAAAFHALAWLLLLIGADDLPGFIGGPGPLLASLHLLTLGVFVMTAMGASYQLLPVATRQPLVRKWPTKLSYWLFMPGTLVLSFGMYDGNWLALYSGAVGVIAGLLLFGLLTADNLRRARSAMPIVSTHGWWAMAALAGFAILGAVLVVDFDRGFLSDRQSIAATHMVLAIFGFMGLLAFGFSHVLIPMFALSRTLPVKLGWSELVLSLLAIIIATAGALLQDDRVLSVALVIGLGACCAYLWLMRMAVKTGMRKRLGLSFVVIKISWGILVLALLVGLATTAGLPIPNGISLFGFLLLAGWLLSFLTGVLQRIMPFLASMHVVGKGGRPPLLSELTTERPLLIHAICHFTALVICSAGIVLDAPLLVWVGAVVGLLGALAFGFFAGFVISKLTNT